MYRRLSDWKDVPILIGASVTATLTVSLAIRLALQGKRKKIIPSSRKTLERLTDKERNELPYPPDVFPGARDVDTPYGSIRVYEFGPADGKKCLLVHGISTPCISLGGVATGLVEKGCRVMIFDLFGRGYSESPSDVDHDFRLYASQIMFVLTSSDLDWKTFSLVGYSLGGGISAAFISYFPKMVESVVLLAPSGLIRPHHIGGVGKFLYSSGILPENLVQWLVRRRLVQRSHYSGPIRFGKAVKQPTNVEDAMKAEVPEAIQEAPLSKSHPNIAVLPAVQWQIKANEGFIHSFVSSIRHAPITGQEATWNRIGLVFSKSKLLIIAGSSDAVIIPTELKEDISQLIPEDRYQWEIIDGGHDFPSSKSVQTVRIISEFWGL